VADEDNIIGIIVISTDKTSYFTEEPIVISGEVTEKKMPIIAIRIFDPDDKILGAYSVEIGNDNHFTKTIIADIPFYEKSGTYTVTAEYGKLEAKTIFKIEKESGKISDVTPIVEKLPAVLPRIVSFGTNKHTYQNEDTIVISGTVSAISEHQVTITIFDPNKTPVGIYLVNVNPDLTFSTSFLAKYNINFKIEGKYSITAQYGNSESKRTEIGFLEKSNVSKNITQKIPVITGSVSKHTNVISSHSSIQDPVVNTTQTSQTKNILHTEKSEINKPEKSDNRNSKNEDMSENTSDISDTQIVYFYSSVKCEKKSYEDVIAHYDNLGPALAHLCKYEDAISFYDQTLQSDPKNIHALTDKGVALASLDRYQEAIAYYDKALEIDPQYVTALNNKEKMFEVSTIPSVHEIEPENIPISNYEPPLHIEDHVEKTNRGEDIASQFVNVFSAIGASLMSLFGG
jgi:tetratricopeptide (TPR) repeat protein